MTYTIIRSDGTTVEVDEAEFDADRILPPQEQLRRDAAKNILAAPAKGFNGPTAKELFNGNR